MLTENQRICEFIQSIDNIKNSNEYEYNKLNDMIKNNLKSINDHIVFKNDETYNYIFLCEIRVNEEFLKEITINKKINTIVRNIELDFINKFSKVYKAKKYYE